MAWSKASHQARRVMSKWKAGFLGIVLISITGWIEAKENPIEVAIEVTEIDHRKASRTGINWQNHFRFQEKTPAGVLSLGSITRLTQLQFDLNSLVQDGAAELLANPNLITDSGTSARFHAGGEIPYITTSSLGNTHVEFKPYGVALIIKPKVLKTGEIQMKIQASVSSPDQANGVLISGHTVPAILEREVESNVTLPPGATMTLAGMVQTVKEEVTSGIPFLRKIPFLGALFRWKRNDFRKTTVVIFVTPRIVGL